jgi:hypothetical protein
MNDNNALRDLQGEIQKTIEKIEALDIFFRQVKDDVKSMPAERQYDLILMAEVFVDFYTCLETGFIRISKFFENNLDSSRRHSHLLEKMTISIPAVRQRVIGDKTYSLLLEFLRFRHFRRYYFEFNYDRDRIEFLEKKFVELMTIIKKDLLEFVGFLERLCNQ